jgi:hypothetical protein
MSDARVENENFDQIHYLNSTLRERIVEHLFVGESLRTLWRQGRVDVEILRSEFDGHGYDLVLSRGQLVRHIQFKTGTQRKPGDVSISYSLAARPSGCVIWIRLSRSLEMGPYFFYGGVPGQPLPSLGDFKIPKRATHNKDGVRPVRNNHRLVPGSQFKQIETLSDLLKLLLDELPTARS